MPTTYYVTKQDILEEAGLSQIVSGEVVSGNANGSNTSFSVEHGPISDSNYDDAVDVTDIQVYVNGSLVTAASVNASAQSFVLAAAPANGAVVTANYRYSNVTDAYVIKVRDEAQDLIDTTMQTVDNVPYSTVPPTVRKMARVYAAGLLLTRDYGSGADTDKTSKDGYLKMALVEGSGVPGSGNYRPGWLDKYLAMGGQTGNSDEVVSGDIISQPDIFTIYDQATQRYSTDDEFMMGIQFENENHLT